MVYFFFIGVRGFWGGLGDKVEKVVGFLVKSFYYCKECGYFLFVWRVVAYF